MLPPKVYNDAQKPGKLWKFSQLFSLCRYLLQVKHLGIWTGRSLYSCISNELLKSTAAPEDCWLNVN